MNSLHTTMFYFAMVMLVVSVTMGIIGIWLPEYVFASEPGWRLFMTALILFGCAVAASAITKWLI